MDDDYEATRPMAHPATVRPNDCSTWCREF